jgi:hypothetical protein
MSSKQNDTTTQFRTCIYLPPRVNSQNPWYETTVTRSFLGNSLTVLQMQMCLIFFGALFFKSIFCRFRIPRFTSMSIVSPIMFLYCHCSYIVYVITCYSVVIINDEDAYGVQNTHVSNTNTC